MPKKKSQDQKEKSSNKKEKKHRKSSLILSQYSDSKGIESFTEELVIFKRKK